MDCDKKVRVDSVTDKKKMRIACEVISKVLVDSQLNDLEIILVMLSLSAESIKKKEHMMHFVNIVWDAKEKVEAEEG